MATIGRVVADGVAFGEGPIWTTDDRLIVTSVADGWLFEIDDHKGTARPWAETGGGPNGAFACADGSVLVTQNGGTDFHRLGLFLDREPVHVTPGLQLVSPDGSAAPYLIDRDMLAPNDLAVGPDGALYFTDPGHFDPKGPRRGRIIRYERDGSWQIVADQFRFCNGIAFTADGEMIVVEKRGLYRVDPSDGAREPIIEDLGPGGGDGFCLDVEGNFYVASTSAHCVIVVSPEGVEVDRLELEGEGIVTNCCFGGPDRRTLYATEAVPGRVVAWDDLPVPGLPLAFW